MSRSNPQSASFYVACTPHLPLLAMQQRHVNPPFWAAYESRVAELEAFDPELVIAFGGDHYDGLHLKLMPTFVIGHIASGMSDCGGYEGRLDVPIDIATSCASELVDAGFDIATSYAMDLDHGFTNLLHNFLGSLDARPVLPVHINALCKPMPTFKRCRELGEAIGRFASGLGKRVAFLGSGGLSHQTDFIFPQYDTAPNETMRDFIVHGGAKGELTREKWMKDVFLGMTGYNELLLADKKVPGSIINAELDQEFLRLLTSDDFKKLDDWRSDDVTRDAGTGGGEIRQWIAACAAARVAGIGSLTTDYYSAHTKFGVGVGVVHGGTN